MGRIPVVVTSSLAVVRAGLRALLHEVPGIEVVGVASNNRETCWLIRERRPQVVLADLSDTRGLRVVSRIIKRRPSMRVVLIALCATDGEIERALDAGVAGVVLRNADAAELEVAIKTVADGQIHVPRSRLGSVSRGCIRSPKNGFAPTDSLTPRQRQILQLTVQGATTKDTARRLRISEKTVEIHRANLKARLHLYTIPALVRYAIQAQLVSKQDPLQHARLLRFSITHPTC
jgi:DNA-binding NarL/FixJ family response regulator